MTVATLHSASAGNICAPFFDSPVDFRSPQYVACQPHFHPMQGHSSMMSPLPETPSHKYIRRGCRIFLKVQPFRGAELIVRAFRIQVLII